MSSSTSSSSSSLHTSATSTIPEDPAKAAAFRTIAVTARIEQMLSHLTDPYERLSELLEILYTGDCSYINGEYDIWNYLFNHLDELSLYKKNYLPRRDRQGNYQLAKYRHFLSHPEEAEAIGQEVFKGWQWPSKEELDARPEKEWEVAVGPMGEEVVLDGTIAAFREEEVEVEMEDAEAPECEVLRGGEAVDNEVRRESVMRRSIAGLKGSVRTYREAVRGLSLKGGCRH